MLFGSREEDEGVGVREVRPRDDGDPAIVAGLEGVDGTVRLVGTIRRVDEFRREPLELVRHEERGRAPVDELPPIVRGIRDVIEGITEGRDGKVRGGRQLVLLGPAAHEGVVRGEELLPIRERVGRIEAPIEDVRMVHVVGVAHGIAERAGRIGDDLLLLVIQGLLRGPEGEFVGVRLVLLVVALRDFVIRDVRAFRLDRHGPERSDGRGVHEGLGAHVPHLEDARHDPVLKVVLVEEHVLQEGEPREKEIRERVPEGGHSLRS